VGRELEAEVRTFAASLPEAWEDHPWGETAFKVGKKVFVYLSPAPDGSALRFTLKLNEALEEAMAFDWVAPARYGLDRGGWVTGTAPPGIPAELVNDWILESYRLVAPRRLAGLVA
jgi:predicted DNA-binding protein (MmcQ/YjbR family)